MPRKKTKRRLSSQQKEEEETPRNRRRSQPDSDEEEEDFDAGANDEFCFSQQAPEASQSVLPERANERRNLDNMDRAAREKAVLSLSRKVLFKALDREPIDRRKIIAEAGLSGDKISSAAFQDVKDNLKNVFGFQLNRVPKYMEKMKDLPTRFRERYYVLNEIMDSDNGAHSKIIHSVHQASSIEKGFLLLTLALVFCKGESRSDGSRWMLGRDLYRLMHNIDDSIPEEPPAQGTARAKASTQKTGRFHNANCTPNVDALLDQFVHMDYLLKEKATEEKFTSQTLEDGDELYSMGPRAAMEVGRRQVIFFCAEILDEEPDPTMLKEIEEELEENDDAYMEPATATQ